MATGAIEIRVEGLDELLRRLGPLTTFAFLRPTLDAALKMLFDQLVIYPPQRNPGSYRRTGTLSRSWTTKIETSSSDLVGKVGSSMGRSYGPYVMDRDRQAWMHQGVWHTVQDVSERNSEVVLGMFTDAIQTALQG